MYPNGPASRLLSPVLHTVWLLFTCVVGVCGTCVVKSMKIITEFEFNYADFFKPPNRRDARGENRVKN